MRRAGGMIPEELAMAETKKLAGSMEAQFVAIWSCFVDNVLSMAAAQGKNDPFPFFFSYVLKSL